MAEPDNPANKTLARMLTIARPPLKKPTSARARFNILSVRSASFISSPARIKNGTAISESVALNILVISILRGIWEYTTVPRQAMPMVNAIGIPKTSSMINIDASITSTFTLLLPETAFTAVSAFLSLPSDDPDSI